MDKSVKNWLNKPIPEEMVNEIETLSNNLMLNVKEFWQGFIESHRHIRGCALRLALLEQVEDMILAKSPKIEPILDKAEFYFNTVMETNLKSLENMSAVGISDTMKELFLSNIFKTQYIEVLCKAISQYFVEMDAEDKERFLNSKKLIVIEELQEVVSNLEVETSKYKFVSKIKQRINPSINIYLKKIGLCYNMNNSYFNVIDKDKFTNFIDLITPIYPNSEGFSEILSPSYIEKEAVPLGKLGKNKLFSIIKKFVFDYLEDKNGASYEDIELDFQKKHKLDALNEPMALFYKIFQELKEKGEIFEPRAGFYKKMEGK